MTRYSFFFLRSTGRFGHKECVSTGPYEIQFTAAGFVARRARLCPFYFYEWIHCIASNRKYIYLVAIIKQKTLHVIGACGLYFHLIFNFVALFSLLM